MVFIIMSPFPFHFLYKLAQVPCCVPERAHQRQPAEMHLQTHHCGVLSSLLTHLSPTFSPLIHLLQSVSSIFTLSFQTFPYFHFCITFFFFSCSSFPISPFPPYFPSIISCSVFLSKHFPSIALRILFFYKLFGSSKGTHLQGSSKLNVK